MGAELKVSLPELQQILEGGSTSYWLKDSLQNALKRDPADALNDALLKSTHSLSSALQRLTVATARPILKARLHLSIRFLAVSPNGPLQWSENLRVHGYGRGRVLRTQVCGTRSSQRVVAWVCSC